jgi:MFS family permease
MTEIAQSPPSAGAPGRTLFISALGAGQICSWGSLYYAFPLIAEQIERETGWARTSLYGAATVGLLFAALASFPIGRAIDRGHGRLIMTGGSVLAGLLLLAWSQVNDLIGLYAVVGLLGALQAATRSWLFGCIGHPPSETRTPAGCMSWDLPGGFLRSTRV